MKIEAKYSFPRECCGFLSGFKVREVFKIDECHPCKNMSQNPESEFRIDPASQIMLQKELRTVNKKILGIYHSHPNGNVSLSYKDRYFFNDKKLLWFIIALSKKKYSSILVYMRDNNIKEKFLRCEHHIKDEKFFKR